MAESFIIFTPNPPNISILTSSGKQFEWTKIKKYLEKILDEYKKNDYKNQEFELFDFIDKTFEEMSHNHFRGFVKKLIEKIKDEMKENYLKPEAITFNSKDKSIIDLSFKNIFSLVNIIIYLIENNNSKGKSSDIIYNFAFEKKIPSFKDVLIYQKRLSQLISTLDSIKTLRISLYKENEDIYSNNENKKYKNSTKNTIGFRMDSKIVFFFSLFYKSLFKSATSAIIDLNIPPIDNYFIKNSNPYLINEEKIINLSDYYKDIIVCNLILIKSLKKLDNIKNLRFEMHDSYQLELHNVLTILLDNPNKIIDTDSNKQKSRINSQRIKSTNDIKKNIIFYSPKFNNNYLYIHHILTSPETSYFDFCFNFNSLDPLLFNSVNFLLTKFTYISNLQLILFPKKMINKRKIYINNCFFNKYANNNDGSLNLYSYEDKKIYYQYLDKNDNNNNSNNFILKDEKLLNELFFSFNKNLIALSIILEKKLNELLSLTIDFSTYNNESIALYNYDNYNCSIVCFIFNLFKAFQLQIDNCKINSLEIFYDDFLDEKSYVFETIKIKIPSCRNGFKLNNLKLNHINFNISNISLILPFENFPSINLTQLIISNLSYNDLNNLVNAFRKNKNIFPVLIKLDMSLGIMVEDYTKPLEILLRECLPHELVYFNLNLPFNISMNQLIDILYWIKCNHNTDININLKIYHSQLSKRINKYYFKNCVIDLFNSSKDYFRKKNILPNYEIIDEHTIKFIINKYNNKNIDNYYDIIYSFNKNITLDIKASNKNIFENIFNYQGNFKKYEINIEITN